MSRPVIACLASAIVASAGGQPAELDASSRRSELPWLRGLEDAKIADEGWYTSELPTRDPDCLGVPEPVFEIKTDLIPQQPGDETVLASLTGGVILTRHDGRVMSSVPGFACEGSADRVELLAVGRSFLEPTIVVIGTTGGHREQVTWLAMFRASASGDRIDPVFTGNVEERIDREVERGWVVLLPGALLHHHPGGGTAVWKYDSVSRAYVPRGWIEPPDASLREELSVADVLGPRWRFDRDPPRLL